MHAENINQFPRESNVNRLLMLLKVRKIPFKAGDDDSV